MPPELDDELFLDGSPWSVVDVAPAYPLAEMAAVLLDDADFEVALFAVDPLSGELSIPEDPDAIGLAIVLVPSEDRERARALLAESVEDFEGGDIERLLALLASEGVDPASVGLDPALLETAARRSASGDFDAGSEPDEDAADTPPAEDTPPDRSDA